MVVPLWHLHIVLHLQSEWVNNGQTLSACHAHVTCKCTVVSGLIYTFCFTLSSQHQNNPSANRVFTLPTYNMSIMLLLMLLIMVFMCVSSEQLRWVELPSWTCCRPETPLTDCCWGPATPPPMTFNRVSNTHTSCYKCPGHMWKNHRQLKHLLMLLNRSHPPLSLGEELNSRLVFENSKPFLCVLREQMRRKLKRSLCFIGLTHCASAYTLNLSYCSDCVFYFHQEPLIGVPQTL